MKYALIIIGLIFLSLPALAQEENFTETIDYASLPEDIKQFIERESNCHVSSDQALTSEQYESFENLYKCKRLCCTRNKLLDRYKGDSEKIKVIKDYNSSLWKQDLSFNYMNECSCPPLNQPQQ